MNISSITKRGKDYIINFDCVEASRIVVQDLHLAKIACKIRLGEFFMIPLSFFNKWFIFKLSPEIQNIILKFKNRKK